VKGIPGTDARETNKSIGALRLILIIFLLFLIAASAIAPYFETRFMPVAYNIANKIPSKICNQYPTHCFYIFGSNMGLCVRCFAIYSSFLYALLFPKIIWSIATRVRLWLASIFFLLPMLIDGITQFYGLRTSNSLLRYSTGLLFGTGISLFAIRFLYSMSGQSIMKGDGE
jgi:uncharacterized membrane protein